MGLISRVISYIFSNYAHVLSANSIGGGKFEKIPYMHY